MGTSGVDIMKIIMNVLLVGAGIALSIRFIAPSIIVLYWEYKAEKEDKREKELTVIVLGNTEDAIKKVVTTDVVDTKEMILDFKAIENYKELKFGDALNVAITSDNVIKCEKVDNLAVEDVQMGVIIKESLYEYTVEFGNKDRVVVEADNTFIVGDSVEVKNLHISIPELDCEEEITEMKRIG